ncbi:MAG: hypothetical protein EXR69_08385 [Myxococcales bacterium]|nr:hypothetical protein [Myxococcales bacterium]
MDGDPATAWVEGSPGDGTGEWLRLPLTPMRGATQVRIRLQNGYAKSANLYKANARARQVQVKLLPSGVTTTATLTDVQGWQELTISQPTGDLEGVELHVISSYPGSKYTDLCVSDLEVYVTATTRENPAAEKAKMDHVVAWKASRVQAAQLFATASKVQIPLAPAYTLAIAPNGARFNDSWECPNDGSDPFCEPRMMAELLGTWPMSDGIPDISASVALAREAFTTQLAGWSPVQLVPKDTRSVPPVEGVSSARLWNCYYEPALYTDEDQVSGNVELPVPGKLGYLHTDALGAFALTDPPKLADAVNGKVAKCATGESDPTTFAWAKFEPADGDTPPAVKAVFLVNCGDIEDREGTARVTHSQLLVYNEVGWLELLVGPRYANAFEWRATDRGPVLSEAWRVGSGMEPVHATEAQPGR